METYLTRQPIVQKSERAASYLLKLNTGLFDIIDDDIGLKQPEWSEMEWINKQLGLADNAVMDMFFEAQNWTEAVVYLS